VHYTPGQLRDVVGLSKEAFRHWRSILPMLATGRKHAPRFTAGDVLATAVLFRLTRTCGVRIGHLTGVANGVFDVCNQTPWDLLEERVLVLGSSEQECLIVKDSSEIPISDPVLVCPLRSLIAALHHGLLRTSPSSSPPATDPTAWA